MIPFWKNAAGRARWTRLLLAAALVWVPLAAQGAILTRLKNGENLKLAAIGTSLTANTDGWFPQTGAWLNGLSYTGKVTLSNRSVAATASQPVPGHPTGGTVQLSTVLANDNPDAVFIEFAINDAYTPYNISQQTFEEQPPVDDHPDQHLGRTALEAGRYHRANDEQLHWRHEQ